MDPIESLRIARESLLRGLRMDARSYLRNYFAWRRKGGFEPQVTVYANPPFSVPGDVYGDVLTNASTCKGKPDVLAWRIA